LKRYRILLLLLLIFLVCPALVCGCVGGAGKAGDLIKEGDEIKANIEQASERLGNKLETMFAELYEDLSSGASLDPERFSEDADAVKSLAKYMIEDAKEARKAYAEAASIEEVGDYADYARLNTEIIDANVAGLEQLKAFLDECAKRMAASPFDDHVFQSFVSEFGNSIQIQGDKTGQLQRKAQDLKEKL